jgi:hypothetical protein
VTIQWSHGFTDQLTLSDDGNQLAGSNGFLPISNSRKSASVPPGEAATTAAVQPTPAPSEGPEPSAETPQRSGANAKPGKAGSCQRLVGVWINLDEEIIVRPDSTAYMPDPGVASVVTGAMACSGQSVIIHWRYAAWGDRQYTVSADGNHLDTGDILDGQYTRTSAEIPPGQEGPPVSPTNVPINPLDLIPFF